VFGLMYAMRALQPAFAQVTGTQNVQLFAAWFLVCIVLTYADVMRVGNVAHGSGAVIGWLIGRAIMEHGGRRSRWVAIAGTAAAIALIAATAARPWLGRLAGDADMLARVGYEAMMRQDYAGAVDDLEKAAMSPSVRPETLVNLGMCYQHLNRDSEALPLYRRAIEMEPRFKSDLTDAMVSILNAQGHDAAKEGMFNEAVGALGEATALKPKDEYAWRLLGFVYEEQGHRARAHECYIRAAIASPDDPGLAEAIKRTAPSDGDP
jgi:tetratricopeptide (TPR) repeat protein